MEKAKVLFCLESERLLQGLAIHRSADGSNHLRYFGCDFGCGLWSTSRGTTGHMSGDIRGCPVRSMFDLPRERRRYPILGNIDLQLHNIVIAAQPTNTAYPATNLLNQPHVVQNPKLQKIPRNNLRAQVFFTHPCRKTTWRHDL